MTPWHVAITILQVPRTLARRAWLTDTCTDDSTGPLDLYVARRCSALRSAPVRPYDLCDVQTVGAAFGAKTVHRENTVITVGIWVQPRSFRIDAYSACVLVAGCYACEEVIRCAYTLRTHTNAHTRTHTRARARARTHTHTPPCVFVHSLQRTELNVRAHKVQALFAGATVALMEPRYRCVCARVCVRV